MCALKTLFFTVTLLYFVNCFSLLVLLFYLHLTIVYEV